MFRGKINTLGILGVSFVFAFLLILVESPDTSAYTATLSITGSNSTDIVPKASGNINTSVTTNEINVITNCRAGYNLTVSAPNDRNLYKDGNSSNNTQGQYLSPVDGSSTLNNTSNAWGYSLTANTESGVFSPLPSTPATLRTPSGTASQTDIDDTISVYYGVSVSNDLAPGQYRMANNGAIVYQLTMDESCSGFTVAFNANGGTGTMSNQEIRMGEATKLTANSFTAPALGTSYQNDDGTTIPAVANKLWTFWGWNTKADGTGDWYKDEESVTNLVNDGNIITLYAQWKQATLADMVAATPSGNQKVIDHNLMQDMTPETCWNSDITTAANAPAATLLDYRGKVTAGDNPETPEQYTISKLADNNCWMTKNLNLGRTSGGPNGNGTITLTSDDTDMHEGSTFTLPAGTITSSTSFAAPRIRVTNTNDNNDNGVYYSFAAASVYGKEFVRGSTSICPKNWDLPAAEQYKILAQKSNFSSSNQTTSAPSSFLINGGFTNGATFYQTGYSHYWTSNFSPTNNSSNVAYGVRINNTSINYSNSTGTTYGGNRYYEKNIRCVASKGNLTVNYDGNGSVEYPTTGTVEQQVITDFGYTEPRSNRFQRNGWEFKNWNTEADESGTDITPTNDQSSLFPLDYRPGETITLYAQWKPIYKITYVNNCKSWASSGTNCTDSASSITSEQKINLDSSGNGSGTLGAYNKFTMTGWKIKEWTTNADGTGTTYPVSSTYSVTGVNPGDSITLYAHWVPIYTVQYDGNGSDNDATGMGSTNASTGLKDVRHTNIAEGDTFDLFASNFKKAGYGFVGWSTDASAWTKLTDNDNTNDAKIWGPNEVITAPAYNGTPITTLYAVWAPAEKTDPTDPTSTPVYLQGWTGCSTMTATTYNSSTGTLTVAKNSITALTDERDGNIYAIAKLADDNCWMIENLRLADTHDESGSTVATTLTTSNTNIDTNNNTLPITNIYNADSTLATKSNSLSPSSSQNSTNDTSYGWCQTSSAACDDQSRLNTTNTVANITPSQTQSVTSANAHTDFYNTIYSYGNYYNWYSATAGYGTYSKSSGNVGGDLCPAGWKLPYGGSGTSGTNIGNTKGGFYYLANQMSATSSNRVNSNKFRMFPNNFIYSGTWNGGSASNRGWLGNYWSASASGSSDAYYLSLYEPYVRPDDYNYGKYRGRSVRCVSGL